MIRKSVTLLLCPARPVNLGQDVLGKRPIFWRGLGISENLSGVDDEFVLHAPLPFPLFGVPAGVFGRELRVRLAAAAPAHRRVEGDHRAVVVARDALARVELARPEHPALLEVRSGAERPVTVRLPPRPPSPARAPRDPRPALRITAATSAALALAAVALGAAAIAQREESLARFNDDNLCLLGSRTRSENCGPDERAALQWQGASAAGFALGALLGAGALASGLASALLRAPSAAPRVSILPRGLHLEGSF